MLSLKKYLSKEVIAPLAVGVTLGVGLTKLLEHLKDKKNSQQTEGIPEDVFKKMDFNCKKFPASLAKCCSRGLYQDSR